MATFMTSWLSVRSAGGVMVLRMEDLDPPRTIAGAAEQIVRDLRWLGLDWDEGPDCGGPHAPYRQSERHGAYDRALARLVEQDVLFPCTLSRKELQDIASAPHGEGGALYPRSARPQRPADGWFEQFAHKPTAQPSALRAAIRFKVEPATTRFTDLVLGTQTECVHDTVGDFVLKRRDGLYAYQLAVVVDDIDMQITEVVRGADLLSSACRQLRLYQTLRALPPRFAHVPLVVNTDGRKLSKRDGGGGVAALRDRGIDPATLTGILAHALGLAEDAAPRTPASLIEGFAWGRIKGDPIVLPAVLG